VFNKLRSILVLTVCVVVSGCGDTGSAPTPEYSGTRRIFLIDSNSQGNLGGIAGADSMCNSDANKPSYSGTFKAMITGATRRACTSSFCTTSGTSEHIDWVFTANTPYMRVDGTDIGTTTENGVFSFNLANAFTATGSEVWTAMYTSWTSRASNCLEWTSDSGSQTTNVGNSVAVTSNLLTIYSQFCDRNLKFFCVEQPMGTD
jgi:hypothetical protein